MRGCVLRKAPCSQNRNEFAAPRAFNVENFMSETSVARAKTRLKAVPAWRWVLVIVLAIFWPTAWHPWWQFLISMALYVILIVALLHPLKNVKRE